MIAKIFFSTNRISTINEICLESFECRFHAIGEQEHSEKTRHEKNIDKFLSTSRSFAGSGCEIKRPCSLCIRCERDNAETSRSQSSINRNVSAHLLLER